ncbi:predicted protein [Aspergillus terreus NIH2624]|uniref:GPI anchored cell wall protein n=1 Tax=Aspergillus terreus (strain NIH 2624 / FGSC A1156) TaxID=341663 RepID=Q0CL75_ASPTN|nr:uncharacterized protein ATEG_05559 [Aspergillus terreus NIH2624]EAU34628.1 predicted protein [Aspergillus terreus NIH2624]
MYFPKSAIVFSFLALTNIAAAASTPACLLSAVGTTLSNPADFNEACVKNSDKLQKQIANTCSDDDLQDALNYYSKTCAQAGHKVDVNISSSSSSSPTGTSSAGSKSTGFTTATAVTSSKSTSSGSQTGSSSASAASSTQTPNSGSSDRHVSAAAFAAVVFVGFAATL